MARDALSLYKAKRNFAVTSEPAEGGDAQPDGPAFVIQKHWASHLHYDLRLEMDGVMKSWAVPKGPSYDPKDKRMAVQVEDHPIAYNQFEGEIPAGQYGAGKVIIWDEGSWTPLDRNPAAAYRKGMLKFVLHGHKMQGHWALIRMHGRGEKQPPWLLVKEKDEHARPAAEFSVVDDMPDSVVPLRTRATTAKPAAKKTAARTTKQSPPGTQARLPDTLQPQLATLVDAVPGDVQDWMFEIKFDGYRLLARVERGKARLFTRNGHDWTAKLPQLAKAIAQLPLKSGWLDGEIVVLDDKGLPDFQKLQNAFDSERTSAIVFYLFDVPFLDGRDLRAEPLETRRALLQALVGEKPPVGLRFSDTFDARPEDLVASACRMGLEGVIGKRRLSTYVPRRSDSWIKLKCNQRQEFVIAGYTAPQGQRVGLGALVLAVHDGHGQLRYAGKVGTGFNDKTLAALTGQLQQHRTDTSPFTQKTPMDRSARWVKPVLLAEVAFGEWTAGGHVRHAVFHGLRSDKPPKAIVREKAVHTKQPQKSAVPKGSVQLGDTVVRITHPERVIDASSGSTKLDVLRYYHLVAPLLLPQLKARPVSMVRAPQGIEGELFFQKHLEGKMPGVKALDKKLDPDHAPLMEVATVQALLSAAQMNVLEFHTWNALKSRIDRPDRITFDLDPGEGVPWPSVQKSAQLVRAFLDQLGLDCWLKTSGGKGLHVVVPIKKLYDWDTAKAFSQAIVVHLAQTIPQLFVAKSGPKNRVGKIFIDYLRNGFGATTAAAWTLRARPGLGISVPLAWDELEQIRSGAHWTITSIHSRLDQGNRVWDGYAPHSLGAAMKALDFTPPR